jgi:diguanylate cyclase (GGDEF)-like protein/PAS domain S-box-containing protein
MHTEFKDQSSDIAYRILLDILTHGESSRTPPKDLTFSAEFEEILAQLTNIQEFALALSNGDLSKNLSVKGPIAGALKNLQANLRHLTWQTQKIAEGDFSQRVDFLGEFSNSFNQMAMKLEAVRSQQSEIDEALRESEQRYRMLVELLPDGVLVHKDGKVVFANSACAVLLRAKYAEELYGREILSLVHPDSRPIAQERIAQILADNKLAEAIEEKFIRLDNTVVDVEISALPIEFEGAKSIQVVIRDITARKIAEAAMDEQVRFEKLLSEISAALVSNPTTGVDQVIAQGLERIAEFVDVDRVSVSTYHPVQQELRVVSSYNRPGTRTRLGILRQKENPWYFMKYAQGETIIAECLDDFPPEAEIEKQMARSLGIASYVGIPIISGGVLLGSFAMTTYQRQHLWPAEIISRIQLIAKIFINVLARDRAEKSEFEQRALAEALRDSAAAFNRSMNVNQVFDCILATIGRVIPHDAVNIMLVEENGVAHIVRHKGYDMRGVAVESGLRVADMPFLKQMSASAEPVIVSDTQSSPTWVHINQKTWVRSYAAMPLVLREKVMGFINLDSATPGYFVPDHITRLRAFADQAAIAFANALLVEDLQRANNGLKKQVAEIEKLRDEMHEQAIRDPLTGLFNRRYLQETLEREIAKANREFAPVSIIVMDLDHFKLVNDTYGHQAGDLMLQALGKLLKTGTRMGDIACRYGGEEFIVVMPGAPAQIAVQRAETIRSTFDMLYVKDGGRILHATLSLGVATYPTHGATGEDVLIRADRALYHAKQAGRNRVISYSGTSPLVLPK